MSEDGYNCKIWIGNPENQELHARLSRTADRGDTEIKKEFDKGFIEWLQERLHEIGDEEFSMSKLVRYIECTLFESSDLYKTEMDIVRSPEFLQELQNKIYKHENVMQNSVHYIDSARNTCTRTIRTCLSSPSKC